MSTSALQDPQTKTPVFLSEQNQETPIGFLFLEGDSLVIEFPGKHPEIRIPQPKARKKVEFIGDSSIRIELPDNSEKKIRLYLSSNGEGRLRFTAFASGPALTEPSRGRSASGLS